MPCEGFDPTRCFECPKDKAGKYLANVVPPDWGEAANGDIVFVGEAPGAQEDSDGRPFVGKTGKEFNHHYLWLAGLDRDKIYVSNAVKCRPVNNKTPSDKLRRSCSEWHLAEEIDQLKPRFVVLMGATACALVDNVSLDLHHGMPLQREVMGHHCTVIPMWHPAVGLHDPKMMLPLRQDFRRLHGIIRGRYEPPVDRYPNPDYRLLNNIPDLKRVMCELPNWDGFMAIDTESEPGRKPFCMTFSCQPGTGYMIRANEPDLLSEMARYIRLWRGQFLFHNYAYDGDILPVMGVLPRVTVARPATQEILAQFGIDIRMDRVRDTMVRAFNLATFQRVGLKVLAYRLLGVEMQEFDDLVMPYAMAEAYEYLRKIQAVDWAKPPKVPKPQPDGTIKYSQPHGLNTLLKILFTHLDKCDGSPDKMKAILIDRWDNWSNDIVMPVIERFGNIPEPNIAQVPIKEVVHYACRDADTTLRLWPVLDGMADDLVRRTAA